MNYKVLLLSLLYCFSTYGQENNKSKSGLSDAELSYAVEEYYKMTRTVTWVEYHRVLKKFTEGMGETLLVARPEYGDKDKLKQWIKENLSMTKFKSIEEAISVVEELDAHSTKVHEENKKLHELIPKATSSQLMKIWQPLADSAMQKK